MMEKRLLMRTGSWPQAAKKNAYYYYCLNVLSRFLNNCNKTETRSDI